MSLPPAWKIRRELLALLDQIKAMALLLTTPFIKLSYEERELKNIKIFEGERNSAQNIVLYLVYQPNGLLESNYSAIHSFISQGAEVLVVSNGELTSTDLARLKPMVWRVIVRENIGYDFGGYRCGLNYIKSNNLNFDSINLINDSIWYPIVANCSIFDQLQNGISDFGGPVCLPDSKFSGVGLVLSYWLTIKKDLLNSDVFWRYWRKYIPTENKTLTVKLGERGLSRQMNKDGRTVAGLFTLDNFMRAIEEADFNQLNLTLRYASFTDQFFEDECRHLLTTAEQNENWRTSCVDFIRRVASKRNFLHSFCYPAISMLGVPFLKKNRLKLQIEMRKKYLSAVENGDLPMPDPHIFKEIEDSVSSTNQSLAFR